MSNLSEKNLVEIPADNGRQAVGTNKTITFIKFDENYFNRFKNEIQRVLTAIKSMGENK